MKNLNVSFFTSFVIVHNLFALKWKTYFAEECRIFAMIRSSKVNADVENNNYQTGILYNKWMYTRASKKTGSINVDHHGVIKKYLFTQNNVRTDTDK